LRTVYFRISLLIICIFGLQGVLPFFESDSSKHERMKAERRKFLELSNIMDSGPALFPERFDLWATDNFAFRSFLIAVNSFFKSTLLGDLSNSRYFRGEQGWFFRGTGKQRGQDGKEEDYNEILDYSGQAPFSEQELKDWTIRLKERKRVVEERGGVFLFAVGPRKSTIYPEYLPTLISRNRGITRLDQLSERLKQELPDSYLDLAEYLLRAKSHGYYPRLYYKTDAHWNYYGAYFAYTGYLERLSQKLPGLQSVPIASFEIKEKKNWYHRGFFSETRRMEREEFPILFPKRGGDYDQVNVIDAKQGFVEEGEEDVLEGQQISLTEVGVGVADMPNRRLRFLKPSRNGNCRYLKNEKPDRPLTDLILIGDSFLQKAMPFFTAHSTNTYFCRQTAAMMLPIFDHSRNEEIRTQVVIQELTEAYLGK